VICADAIDPEAGLEPNVLLFCRYRFLDLADRRKWVLKGLPATLQIVRLQGRTVDRARTGLS